MLVTLATPVRKIVLSVFTGTIRRSIRQSIITNSAIAASASLTFLAASASAQPAAVETSRPLAVSEIQPESSAASREAPAATTAPSPQAASTASPQPSNDRYRDGMVIWETPPDASVPFLLKFNMNTQLRYLNTQDSEE